MAKFLNDYRETYHFLSGEGIIMRTKKTFLMFLVSNSGVIEWLALNIIGFVHNIVEILKTASITLMI